MNFFKLSLILFFIFINAISIASDKISSSDFYFLWGTEEFFEKRYGNSADLFYLTLVNQPQPKILDQTLLYLSLSQFFLNDKKKASYNLTFVDRDKLSATDKIRFQNLKKQLSGHYEKALNDRMAFDRLQKEWNIWFTPYYGQTSYSNLSTRDGATFSGVSSTFSKKSYSFSLSGEYFDLRFKDGSSSYNQTQLASSITKLLTSSSLSGRYTQITSPNKQQSGIKVYGVGVSFFTSLLSKLNLDFYFSHYPQYSIGKMNVNQLTPSFDFDFDFHPRFNIWLRAGHQFVKPSSESISNGTTFISEKIYQRSFIDLNLKLFNLTLGGNYWMGEEAFGVRNDGNLVFSGLEEHVGGVSAYTNFEFGNDLKIQFTYMKEAINTDGVKSSSSAYIGSLFLLF